MREPAARPGAVRILSLVAVLALVLGCAGAAAGGDGDDTDVAGVVIERDDPSASGTVPADGTVVASGPAGTGITWSVVDGDWIGLGARTLTDGDDADHLLLDVAAGEDVGRFLRDAGCELALQAPDDAPLVVRGELEAALVVESATGELRRVDLDPAAVDVVLAPGELHRAALPDGGGVRIDAEEAAEVRCEGRFRHT